MYKLPAVAEYLGISLDTARRYVKSGEIPSTFIGGAYRVEEEDLKEFVESKRSKSPKATAPSVPGLPEEGTPQRALLEAASALEQRAGETAPSVTSDYRALLYWAEGLTGSITTLVKVAQELGVEDESERIWQPSVIRVIQMMRLKKEQVDDANERTEEERQEINRKFKEIVERDLHSALSGTAGDA